MGQGVEVPLTLPVVEMPLPLTLPVLQQPLEVLSGEGHHVGRLLPQHL